MSNEAHGESDTQGFGLNVANADASIARTNADEYVSPVRGSRYRATERCGFRVYASKKGISPCYRNEAEFILRLRSDAFSMYRYRRQIELYFKRLKSLLGMGEVPKKRADCMEAWLNGKMILALLFEVLLSKLDFFPLGQFLLFE